MGEGAVSTDRGLLIPFDIERETDPHERASVGSDLYAHLIEGAIRSAGAISGGIRQG